MKNSRITTEDSRRDLKSAFEKTRRIGERHFVEKQEMKTYQVERRRTEEKKRTKKESKKTEENFREA